MLAILRRRTSFGSGQSLSSRASLRADGRRLSGVHMSCVPHEPWSPAMPNSPARPDRFTIRPHRSCRLYLIPFPGPRARPTFGPLALSPPPRLQPHLRADQPAATRRSLLQVCYRCCRAHRPARQTPRPGDARSGTADLAHQQLIRSDQRERRPRRDHPSRRCRLSNRHIRGRARHTPDCQQHRWKETAAPARPAQNVTVSPEG